MSEIACLTCLIEASLKTLIFAFAYMILSYIHSGVGQVYFILDSLYLVFFHFLSNCSSEILRTI